MVEQQELETSLTLSGMKLESITTVSDTDEPVYKVITRDGKYFVKVLSAKKGEAMRDVLDQKLPIEIPQSKVIYDRNHILVMKPARGYPLSEYLPVCLFPGLWWRSSDSISDAVQIVGAALGELHTGTYIEDRRVDDNECRMANWLELRPLISDYFDEDTVKKIDNLFGEIRMRKLPFVRVHGDPTPHNIFWHRHTEKIDIIDFNLHKSVALEDLVVFDAGIELMAARLPYGRKSQKRALTTSFRKGYQKSGVHETIPNREFDILTLSYYCHLLNKYLHQGMPNTTREKLTMQTDKHIIRVKITSLLSEL